MVINLLSFFIFIFIATGVCKSSEAPRHFDEMCGRSTILPSEVKGGQNTYAKIFEAPDNTDIVMYIGGLENSGFRCKQIGSLYSCIGKDEVSTSYRNSFFETIKTLDSDNSNLTSCEYALITFKEQLEALVGIPLQEIFEQYQLYGTSFIIDRYFMCTREPKDGDLAVYSGEDKEGYVHSGIYRKTKQDCESMERDTVESKWSTIPDNPYVFKHDVFFIPKSYGNVVLFYRLKEKQEYVPSAMPNVSLMPSPMYSYREDKYYVFKRTELTASLRRNIENTVKRNPSNIIEGLNKIKDGEPFGACYYYAFEQISLKQNIMLFRSGKFPLTTLPKNKDIETYFSLVDVPEEGDLACYYNTLNRDLMSPVHFGVYCSNGRIESQWGMNTVYQHQLFHVPLLYGDYLRFYRFNGQ